MSASKMRRTGILSGTRTGPYNRPGLKTRSSITTGPGSFLNDPMLMTTAMRSVLSKLPEFDEIPSPETDEDAVEQASQLEDIGLQIMKTEESGTGMAGGGLVSDALAASAEAGKNLFLGVYATYLMKPTENVAANAKELIPRLKTYLKSEVDKFVNLDSDSQVLRAIKIFVALSSLYTAAPFVAGGVAAVTPIITSTIAKTSGLIIPLLPSILYYLSGLGFLMRYGAGYYSMMAIINFYLFPADLVTPTSAVLAYMLQKHIAEKHPEIQELGRAFVAEKKQEIATMIQRIRESRRAGTENLKARLDMLKRPLFNVLTASDDLLKVLVDTMMSTGRLATGDVTAAKQYIQFLIDSGRAYRESPYKNAEVADLIGDNSRTIGEAIATAAAADAADADIMDLGIGAHLLADALVTQENNEPLTPEQATEVAMALLDLSKAPAAAPANNNFQGGKRHSNKTKKNKKKSSQKHKKQTKKQKKQTKKHHKKRQAKKHTKKH